MKNNFMILILMFNLLIGCGKEAQKQANYEIKLNLTMDEVTEILDCKFTDKFRVKEFPENIIVIDNNTKKKYIKGRFNPINFIKKNIDHNLIYGHKSNILLVDEKTMEVLDGEYGHRFSGETIKIKNGKLYSYNNLAQLFYKQMISFNEYIYKQKLFVVKEMHNTNFVITITANYCINKNKPEELIGDLLEIQIEEFFYNNDKTNSYEVKDIKQLKTIKEDICNLFNINNKFNKEILITNFYGNYYKEKLYFINNINKKEGYEYQRDYKPEIFKLKGER